MGRKSREGVLKRQRERKKAEKAALKREQRHRREPRPDEETSPVASREDLEGYGVIVGPGDDAP